MVKPEDRMQLPEQQGDVHTPQVYCSKSVNKLLL